MVQRLLILCDIHAARDEEMHATPPAVTIGLDGRVTELDLCQSCKDQVNALLTGYFEQGRRPTDRVRVPLPAEPRPPRRQSSDTPAPRTPSGYKSTAMIQPAADGKFYCDQPGCWRTQPGQGLPTSQAISTHRRASHGIDRVRHFEILAEQAAARSGN